MKNKGKVILAYSGGLDTSVILKWLIEEGYDVVAYIADVGQDEDLESARNKAEKMGACAVYIEDLKEEFVTDYIFPLIKSGAIYEGRYLMGTSIARPLIAKYQIDIASKENAAFVAHGATGKGNDQVRFELSYYALKPDIQVISPWKMDDFLARFRGRSDMIHYAEQHGIPIKASRPKPYSEDDNLMHISHEAGILEDPYVEADEDVYSRTAPMKDMPDEPDVIAITFQDGIPVQVKNKVDRFVETRPLALFQYLNGLGTKHGIGRVDMVENRFVGIKSRGVTETPGGMILFHAHRDLEGLTMDRETMRLRDMLAPEMARVIYNGFWFSPEMEFLMAAMDKAQEMIDGTVELSLYKGSAYPIARTSPVALYDADQSSMDIEGGYDQKDAEGFIKINAIRLKAHHLITKKAKNEQRKRAA